ncbi:MAG: MarR family winged helix-turn-helix transcriptional regulator [Candidatus Pristimantibacillus sp.]
MDIEYQKQIVARYEAAHFTVNRKLTAMMRELMPEGLTVDQYMTLRYMRNNEECTSSELADIFCVGKSSITAIITRLVDKQLIVRVPDDKDRRVTFLKLTEEGKEMSDVLEVEIQKLIGTFLCHFDEQEAHTFLNTFEKLALVMGSSTE